MWEFIKKEENARALAILVPLIIALITGTWTLFGYLSTNTDNKSVSYSIYLDSAITPFNDSFVKSYYPPYKESIKSSDESSIWYLRRNKEFVPHSMDLFFDEISELKTNELIQSLNAIPENNLLHETLLPAGFYQIMLDAGEKLNTEFRKFTSANKTNYPALKELFDVELEHPGSIAALYMYHTTNPLHGFLNARPNELLQESHSVWSALDEQPTLIVNNNLATSLLLRQFNPVILITISNPTETPIIVSDIIVGASRIKSSASGVKSQLLEAIDTIHVPLKGIEEENIARKLKRPLNVSPGDTATFRVILDSELMFIYKIEITLFDGAENLHTFEPFIADFFSEL